MKNKALKRIFKKNFEINSQEELVELISKLKAQTVTSTEPFSMSVFLSRFEEVVELLDKSFNDFDRVLDIRDRSLEVSSREMTVMNDEIQKHANQQAAILSQLQSTIEILNPEKAATAENNNKSLDNLIETVNHLVRVQLDSVKWQRTLFTEGIKICSVLNFKSLEKQIRISVENVTNVKLQLHVYFTGGLFEKKDAIEFYQCDDHNNPIDENKLSQLSDKVKSKFINVVSPKGNGTLAIIQLIDDSKAVLNLMESHLERISPLVPSIASTLENIKLLKDEKRQQYIEAELSTARIVQQTLLPTNDITSQNKVIELNAYYQSATECGGDWWSHFKTEDGKHIVLVGDVTGHGTGSAMLCAVVKGYCDSFANRPDISVSQILKELNTVVYKMALKTNRMMTMAAFAMDPETGQCTFASAGHPMPIYFQANSPNTLGKSIIASGPILGLHNNSEFKEINFQFNYDDMIIFYTDGLTECNNHQGAMYGDARFERLIKSLAKLTTAKDLNKAIILDVQQFAIGEPFADDITSVVIKRLKKNS